jgi:hypothetical protein
MNRHKLTYVDLHPQPVKVEEAPPLWAQVLGGLIAAAALYLSLVFLFSL